MGRVERVAGAAGTMAVAALCIVSSALGASSDNPPGTISISSVPNVSIGDTITINGQVASNGIPIPGIDVTVRLYTLPDCASGASPKTVLTTAADGTFAFTDTISVQPPLSYGFLVGLSQDPTRPPDFGNRDQCVTLNPTAKLSGKSEGDVVVNGKAFTSGVVSYGSVVELAPGSALKLATDVGKFRFFPVAGAGTTFVPVRVALPTPAGKKKQFVVELRLVNGNFTKCPGGVQVGGLRTESARKPGPPNSLWGSGKGHYRTRGRYSSATVTGTHWLVADVCGGTLTVVQSGTVRVVDLVKKKTIILHAGQRYLAHPR